MLFKDKGTYDSLTKTAVIMRDGVYTYMAGELPFLELKDGMEIDTKLRVYRSPESVRAAYQRFKELGKIPVVFEHPEEDLDLKDYSQGYGYDPELVEEGINVAIKCKLKLQEDSREAYEELGIREISCGWSGDFREAEHENDPYDYEQTFEEFNHIALVPEGRCGTLCSIKDQKNGAHMKAKKVKDAKTHDSLIKAGKYLDEIAEIAKKSEEIEDSHAEGLLTAIQGLKEAISGFEAFASQEEKEPMQDEAAEGVDESNGEASPVKTETTDAEPQKEDVIEDEDGKLEEADVKVKEVNDISYNEVDKVASEGERKGLKGKDLEKYVLEHFKGRDIEDECKDEAAVTDEVPEEDKRKLIGEADAIAMKSADEFEGGAEEKFRTLTKKLEELGYSASSRGTANDAKASVLDAKTKAYLKKRIDDATNLGMKLAVKRFHDVLPYIADGTISFADIKPGMTPCEIKQKYVEEKTGKRITDTKALNVAFEIATKASFNDAWKVKDFHADVLDEKANDVDMIGVKRKGDK